MVATVDVEVFRHRRSQVGDVLVGDVEPGVAEPVDSLPEQLGVERGDAVDDQAEAQESGKNRGRSSDQRLRF